MVCSFRIRSRRRAPPFPPVSCSCLRLTPAPSPAPRRTRARTSRGRRGLRKAPTATRSSRIRSVMRTTPSSSRASTSSRAHCGLKRSSCERPLAETFRTTIAVRLTSTSSKARAARALKWNASRDRGDVEPDKADHRPGAEPPDIGADREGEAADRADQDRHAARSERAVRTKRGRKDHIVEVGGFHRREVYTPPSEDSRGSDCHGCGADRRMFLRRRPLPARERSDVRALLPLQGLPAADGQRLRSERADRSGSRRALVRRARGGCDADR